MLDIYIGDSDFCSYSSVLSIFVFVLMDNLDELDEPDLVYGYLNLK